MNERIIEADFKEKSEQAILDIERAFGELAEQREIDVQVEGGVLTVTFEEDEPGKFILSPNSSVRQLWLSARMSSFKFDWSEASRAFILSGSDESLKQVIIRLTREQLSDDAVEM
jgi:CyaY protein